MIATVVNGMLFVLIVEGVVLLTGDLRTDAVARGEAAAALFQLQDCIFDRIKQSA